MEEPAKFMLMFPCFAIMTPSGKGAVVQHLEGGRTGLVLLSDEDLLLRYRREHGLSGPTIRFDHAAQVALYLEGLPPEITHVILDPGDASFVSVTIPHFIEKVLKTLE